MDYSINTKTGEIKKGNLGSFFRKGDWVNALDDNGNIISEYQDAFNLDLLEEAKNIKIQTCREYLKKTDWYCLRFADRGIEYPEEVKNKREQARNFTNDIEALTTLAEVEAFNIDAIL